MDNHTDGVTSFHEDTSGIMFKAVCRSMVYHVTKQLTADMEMDEETIISQMMVHFMQEVSNLLKDTQEKQNYHDKVMDRVEAVKVVAGDTLDITMKRLTADIAEVKKLRTQLQEEFTGALGDLGVAADVCMQNAKSGAADIVEYQINLLDKKSSYLSDMYQSSFIK